MTPCPINECGAIVDKGKLMCLKHWRMVPRDIQAQVYAAAKQWNKNRDLESGKALRARQAEAIAAVEAYIEAKGS